MTPPAYLMARTEVPVTMGRRVLSLVADKEDVVEERTDPPEFNVRDMVRISNVRRKLFDLR